VNDSNIGPFKNFRVLWFPFSTPATVLGIAAAVAFHLVNVACAAIFDAAGSAGTARALFFRNLESVVLTLSLAPLADESGWMFLVQAVFAIAIWATLGLGMSRALALRLCRDEYIGTREAFVFGFSHCGTTLLYPAILAACFLVLLAANALLGGVMQIPWVGVLAYPFLPVAYGISAAMLVILLTGLFGAGMVSGAIAVERRGTLDAWGKALNYIFARPIQFVAYIIVVKIFLVDIVYRYAIEGRILHRWTDSALSPLWSRANFERIQGGGSGLHGLDRGLATVYEFFGTVATACLWGLLIASAAGAFTAMFLILRRDVDGIDVSEIDTDVPLEEPPPAPVAGTAAEPGAAGDGPD